MKSYPLLLILSLLFFNAFAQTEKEQIDFLYQMTFEMNKGIFEKKDYSFKVEKLDSAEVFPKLQSNKTQLLIAIDSLQKSATLEVKDSGNYGNNLIFNAKFPNGFNEENLTSKAEINVSESKLFSSNKELIILKGGGGYSIGNEFSVKYDDDEVIEEINRLTVFRQSQFEDGDLSDTLYSGSVIYEASFLTGYDAVMLSKNDISKTFSINGIDYKLIDILHNKVVLETSKEDENLSILNLDKDGNVLKNYAAFELYEMKEKDDKVDVEGAFSYFKSTVYKMFFDYFQSNPNATLEEYKKAISVDDLKTLKDAKEYLIILTVAPIEHQFVLYEPIYGVSKTFEVKYTK